MTDCWHCKKKLTLPDGPIPFKATCDYCGSWVHICKLCTFYSPGKPNDCMIPDTHTPDKEKANHCDEFKLITNTHPSSELEDKNKIEQRLFGSSKKQNQEPTSPKDRFHQLFNEDD